MEVNKEYWSSLIYPLCPSIENVLTFSKHLVIGNTLLLGCTRELIPLSDEQMDLDPLDYAPNPIICNWLDNKTYYNNIIGDGVLNLTKDLCDGIIEMCSKHCQTFISRSFNYRLPTMRIAVHFPTRDDFLIIPEVIETHNEYTFFKWNFNNNGN